MSTSVLFNYGHVKLHMWTVLYLALLPYLRSVTHSASISEDAICAHHFNHKVQKCMRPFLELYQSHHQAQKQGFGMDDLITKHLCFEYEKTLQCLHSALSSCPTLKNVQRVQHKLSAEWVTDVNQLCRIQSENINDDNETDESDEMDYLINITDKSEDKTSYREITNTNSLNNKHKSNFPPIHSVKKKTDDPLWSRVIKVRQVEHSEGQESASQSASVEYQIYNIITNYRSTATSCSCLSVMLWILVAVIYILEL